MKPYYIALHEGTYDVLTDETRDFQECEKAAKERCDEPFVIYKSVAYYTPPGVMKWTKREYKE